MKKIILIGTGNLGKRYLQAILNARGEFICHCHDIDREALDGIPEFLRRNNISSMPRMHYLFSDILGEIDRNSLVIVASTAGGRREMISEIAALQPAAMIIEKPVAQTADDYLHIMNECSTRGIDGYTHYTLRFQPFCAGLKIMVDGEKTFEFILSLPAMGLACVSIHY
ncbi:MAG: Gfo/Idh/MocA family oxidoreductase, partial [Bacteroidales bacterium]|nr:Gfo/Idh/MocA family oxidoreductase [Bacteroidales bacterium]